MALEASRQLHEEIETLERAAMVVLDHKPHGAKAKVCKDHVVSNLVGSVVERGRQRTVEQPRDARGGGLERGRTRGVTKRLHRCVRTPA